MHVLAHAHTHTQVEKFYTKLTDDLESELTNLDPTVPIRSVIEEQQSGISAANYNSPWVMRGDIWGRYQVTVVKFVCQMVFEITFVGALLAKPSSQVFRWQCSRGFYAEEGNCNTYTSYARHFGVSADIQMCVESVQTCVSYCRHTTYACRNTTAGAEISKFRTPRWIKVTVRRNKSARHGTGAGGAAGAGAGVGGFAQPAPCPSVPCFDTCLLISSETEARQEERGFA